MSVKNFFLSILSLIHVSYSDQSVCPRSHLQTIYSHISCSARPVLQGQFVIESKVFVLPRWSNIRAVRGRSLQVEWVPKAVSSSPAEVLSNIVNFPEIYICFMTPLSGAFVIGLGCN